MMGPETYSCELFGEYNASLRLFTLRLSELLPIESFKTSQNGGFVSDNSPNVRTLLEQLVALRPRKGWQ